MRRPSGLTASPVHVVHAGVALTPASGTAGRRDHKPLRRPNTLNYVLVYCGVRSGLASRLLLVQGVDAARWVAASQDKDQRHHAGNGRRRRQRTRGADIMRIRDTKGFTLIELADRGGHHRHHRGDRHPRPAARPHGGQRGLGHRLGARHQQRRERLLGGRRRQPLLGDAGRPGGRLRGRRAASCRPTSRPAPRRCQERLHGDAGGRRRRGAQGTGCDGAAGSQRSTW